MGGREGGSQRYFYFRHLISKVKSNKAQNCQPWVPHLACRRWQGTFTKEITNVFKKVFFFFPLHWSHITKESKTSVSGLTCKELGSQTPILTTQKVVNKHLFLKSSENWGLKANCYPATWATGRHWESQLTRSEATVDISIGRSTLKYNW